MQTLPQPADSLGEARPVSEILSRADPADMPAMRAGLSFLTSAGAELATALEKSNQENQRLMAIVSALPPEWVEAATTGAAFPDIGSLRAEVELLKDERIDLRGQLVERDQLIGVLNEQVAQIQVEQDSALSVEEREALQAEMDSISLARSQAEDGLRSSQAELADIEQQLAGLSADFLAALPEEVQAQMPAAPADDQTLDSRQRRAMRLGALAAAASALVERGQQSDALAEEANTRAAAVQDELEAATAARMALEADLGEKEHSLEDLHTQVESLQSEFEGLNAQIEQLKEQATALQGELDATLAAKALAEEQLVAREGELAELNQQIDSVGQQLRVVLPEDVLAQIVPADEEAPSEEMGEEALAEEAGEDGEIATRSAAPKMLGLGALVAGVAAAVDLSQQKSGEAAAASGLLASVEEQKVSLEGALGEKEQAIAELNAQIEALNAQTADVQAQLAAALAVTAGLEQQAGEREGLLGDLQGQIQDAVSRLQEIVPAEDLPQPEIAETVEGEAAEGEAAEGEAGAVQAVGLPALVTGVAALVDRNSSSLAELQAQLAGLNQEKAALDAALEEKMGELAGYNDYALSLQGQVNELAAQVTSAEAALALKEQAEVEAQAQIEALTAQIESLNAQVADLQTQLDAAVGAKAELEEALQATQAQLDTAQADLAQIDEESQRALGDKAVRLGAVGVGAAAVAAIRDKEDALAAVSEQALALQTQIDDLSAERDSIVLSKDELQTTLQGREAELADLRSQLEALQRQVAVEAEERGAAEEQLAQMEESLSEVDDLRSATLSFDAASTLSETLARLPKIKTNAASAAIVAGVQPTLSPRIQALTDVKGIGSVYQQRLYRAGVGTYWELASLPDSDMQETLQIPELQRPRIDFEETRADAYEWAKQTGTIGLLWDGDHVDDFESLPGIGKTFEKRLYEAGITTYEQLLAADVERLAEIVQAPPMREVNYDEMKERAQQFLAERLTDQPAG